MMKYKEDVISQFGDSLAKVELLFDKTSNQLFNKRPAENKWSAAECIEHMIITNSLYLDKMNEVLNMPVETTKEISDYKPRVAAEKIIRLMEPPVKIKVKTPGIFIPKSEHKKSDLLKEYVNTLKELIAIFKKLDPSKLLQKISSPAMQSIKLQAGEVFLLIAVHDRRHLWQAENTLKSLSNEN